MRMYQELEAEFGDPFPPGWTADELMATDFPPIRWAVPGIVAEGLSLLVGAPKLGKSWLGLNIATAIALGGRALGKIPVEQGTALYLALEDPGRRLKDRLRIVLEGADPPPSLHLHPEWPLLHDGGLDLLDRWLTLHPDTRVVVVDVLARIRGRVSERESVYAADYGQMIGLKEAADKHGVAVIVVHHARKAGSTDFLDAVSGTAGLAGAADAVMVLTRSRGASDAVLKVTGRDVEEVEHALRLDVGRWLLLDGPASDYETSESRRKILNAVREAEGLGPKAIALASGVDHEVVKKLVVKMVDANQLDTDGQGHYFPLEGKAS